MKEWSSATHIDYVRDLVNSGGPQPNQYREVDEWIRSFYAATDEQRFNGDTLAGVRHAMISVLSPATMLGWAYRKPHGYSGDFEIIDRHYLNYTCSDPKLINWDRYWQAGPAACAVRNRKTYFHKLIEQRLDHCNGHGLRILNLGSGPARDVFEFLNGGNRGVHFDCVDHDQKAIDFASNLCRCVSDRVVFAIANVVRLSPAKRYDLIWAAGLFDYFGDSLFKRVLQRLLPSVLLGGELVIGNFSADNPNIPWLRFCEWHLHHRTEQQLMNLAVDCGIGSGRIGIGREPNAVNLFLHIRN